MWLTLALSCPCIAVYEATLAWAELLRQSGDPARVMQSIRLDPLNATGHTLQAEICERSGWLADAERAWREALRLDPRSAEARVRLANLAEQRGDFDTAERWLLQAADASHTWLPRWALVNFYIRRGRPDAAGAWGRAAMNRAFDDVPALFRALDDAVPGWEHDLPENRRVLVARVEDRLARNKNDGLAEVAERLARLIPQNVPDWPGLDRRRIGAARNWPADDWERTELFGAMDRLLDLDRGHEAVNLWNLLCDRAIVPNHRWTAAEPVVNSRFGNVGNAGLDWRLPDINGLRATILDEAGLNVTLSGEQPDFIDAVWQRTLVPARRAYRLLVVSRTAALGDASGLRWVIRQRGGGVLASAAVPISGEWTTSTAELRAASDDRLLFIALACERPTGRMRAEGSAWFRSVRLEPMP